MPLNEARINMIKQQIRTWEVTNEHVVELFSNIDRAEFVAPEYRDLAYADMMLPIGFGQAMLSPKIQAKMLQALNLKKHERVLEVGTGNGFFTSLLARLAAEVISVEIHRDLLQEASGHLHDIGINNVKLALGNAASGWELDAPVDVVVITGALAFLPNTFKACLQEQGRIIAILGDAPAMQVSRISRMAQDQYQADSLFETEVPYLLKAAELERFVF